MSIAVELPATPMTLDDVNRLTAADSRFELSEGHLIVMSPPTWRHQHISVLLCIWFSKHGYEDRVNVAPGVRTADDNLNGRIPDVVVTTAPVPDHVLWLAPETVALAIEIVSKSTERTDRWFKPIEYAAAGIPRFWRVEPDEVVVQFELAGAAYKETGRVALTDRLAGDGPDLG
jgi:Uma2 family endonuclease